MRLFCISLFVCSMNVLANPYDKCSDVLYQGVFNTTIKSDGYKYDFEKHLAFCKSYKRHIDSKYSKNVKDSSDVLLCTSDEFYKLYGAYKDQFNESNRIVNAVGGMGNAFMGVTSPGCLSGSSLSTECFNKKFNMNLITKPLEAIKLAPTSKRIDESTINLSKMRSLFKH